MRAARGRGGGPGPQPSWNSHGQQAERQEHERAARLKQAQSRQVVHPGHAAPVRAAAPAATNAENAMAVTLMPRAGARRRAARQGP